MKQDYRIADVEMKTLGKTLLRGTLLLVLVFSMKINAQNITYSFENAEITNDGANTFYEVDIMFTTDTDLQLGSGQFYLNYNTAAFGENISGSGNFVSIHPDPSVGFELLPEYILDGNYDAGGFIGRKDIYQIVVNDNTTSRVSIAYIQNEVQAAYQDISGSHKLARIKIQYTDVNEDPMISFDALGDDQTFTAGTSPTSGDGTQLTNDTLDSNNSEPAILWTGTTDGDWNTSGNWSANLVPGSTRNVTIPAGLTNYPTATGAVDVNSLTIESGASFIAQGAFTGTLTYTRNLSTSDWYLVAPPVVGQDEDDFVTASNLQASVANPGNIALGTYDTATNSWNYYNGNTGAAVLDSGKGYIVNLDASSGDISFTGSMLTTDTSVDLTITGLGYNLIGNPYPSFISSADLLTTSTGALNTQTLWLWDPTANGGLGAYETKVTVDDFKIAPGQAFFVQSDGATGSVAINESFQSHETTDTFKSATNERPELHLFVSQGTGEMQTKVYYIDGTTTGFDNGYDGLCYGGVGGGSLKIFSRLVDNSSEDNFAIQSLPENNYENMIIPIGIEAVAAQDMTFRLESFNMQTDINVYLEDKETNRFVKLNENGADYTISISNDSSMDRFYLHTTRKALSTPGEIALENVNMFISSPNNLRIEGVDIGEKAEINIYNILGGNVLFHSFTGNSTNDIDLSGFRSGVYIAVLKTKKGVSNKKIVME